MTESPKDANQDMKPVLAKLADGGHLDADEA